ncbi:Transcription factor PERIANTHIA [Hibiscus syriacus]|uniref:Transcription factor PERIANTHIA n=1 Tax=Hibiscus syriacus TaxID=106335 RepID=A0A6A3BJH6_HIBSY|nr:Transcription factor PERIANTHIA [Hibiscus syriacus]
MQKFKAAATTNPDMFCHSSFFISTKKETCFVVLTASIENRGDDCNSRHQERFLDLGELDHPVVAFHHNDAVDLSPSSIFSLKSSNVGVVANSLEHGTQPFYQPHSFNFPVEPGVSDTGQFMYQKGAAFGSSLGNGHIENWADSVLADNSQQTDTSTDVDTDHNTQLNGLQHRPVMVDLVDQSKSKCGDQKTLHRLAQNREAAKKSRLRKKAYVQQLESSRLRLSELEQELQRARQQSAFITTGLSGDHGHSVMGNAALVFDMEYGLWVDEHQRLINDLRSAVNSHMGDNELCILVGGVMAHFDEVFRLKSIGTKADAFHMLSGMWKTPAERCFMWLGGFRSSELLKILGNHLEPLTDQQLMGICNLQQSSQQAEDALSQGMEALQQSLVDTLSSACLGPASGNVADYMSQMAIAMGKLATLENFLHQADLLRQQTLQQMHRILTSRQAAQALLVISDYTSRLRALSSLWLARPRN